MDYVTLERVKAEARITLNTDDTLLAQMITSASRALDRRCTGVSDASAHDYFKLEAKTAERLSGQVNVDGEIICYPHKPVINSVEAFSYQLNITATLKTVDLARVDTDGTKIIAYPTNLYFDYPSRCRVTTSYTGGFSGSAASLPEDLQEICALLAIRFYRESETGLSDVIGVPELGILQYTKAWPSRVESQLDTFIRRQGWNHVG